MKLLFDAIAFGSVYQRGIQRYFIELMKRLCTSHSVDMLCERETHAQVPGSVTQRIVPPWRPIRRPHVFDTLKDRFRHRSGMRSLPRYDLFHSTWYHLSPIAGLPTVVTFHDLTVERFPDLRGDWGARQADLRSKIVDSVSAVIAVSRATADEAVAFYPQIAGKLHVVHHGCEHLVPGAAHAPAGVERPFDRAYVLYVGMRPAYKNFRTLLETTARRDWPGGLKLVVVGQPFDFLEEGLIRRLGVMDRVTHAGPVGDTELHRLYRHARAFVFPSLSEGFGLPILEAQCFGAPVICSDIPAFREVAGDSAIYFNPLLTGDINQRVGELLDNSALRATLIDRGTRNLARFSWDRCAEQTLAVYRTLIPGGSR